MGLFDSIFGGQKTDVKASSKANYPDWWLNMYRPVLQDMQGVYQQQAAHPLNPLQTLGYQGLTSAALGNIGQTQQNQNYVSQLLGQHPQAQAGIPSLQSLISNFKWGDVPWSGVPHQQAAAAGGGTPGGTPPGPAPSPHPAPQPQPQPQPSMPLPGHRTPWVPPGGLRPEDVPARAAYAATIGQNPDLAKKLGASQLSYLSGRLGQYGWTG
jgi:hypothetical protein